MEQHPEIAIRHAAESDAREIADIHLDGWDWAYRDTPLHHHLDSHPAAEREQIWTTILGRHGDGARLWLALRDEAIVGFIATGPLRRPAGPSDGMFELYALYQRRAAAHTGVARRLVTDAVADLRGRACRSIQLSVYASNQGACRFYERQGWCRMTEEAMDYHGAPLLHIRYQRLL